MMDLILVILAIVAVSFVPTEAFGVKPISRAFSKQTPCGPISASPSNADDLFKSDGWPAIEKSLDSVPVFTCANEEGKPIQYAVTVKDDTYQVPFFYCDVEEAKGELEKARAETKMRGLDLIPVPLGKAFQMWAQDKAVIIPSKDAVMAAGAPPGANPIGQEIPLFACMDIMSENEDGTAVLPLFMVLKEANDAMDQAVQMDGGNSDDFEVVCLSLPRAVELLATVPETPAFQFIPPKASIDHIQDYLSS